MIPDKILNVFNRSIEMVCNNIACYCNDPISDFTRKRKLPVETLIHFIIQMQSKSLNSELCEYFNDIDSLLPLRLFVNKGTSLISVLFKESCICLSMHLMTIRLGKDIMF